MNSTLCRLQVQYGLQEASEPIDDVHRLLYVPALMLLNGRWASVFLGPILCAGRTDVCCNCCGIVRYGTASHTHAHMCTVHTQTLEEAGRDG